MQGVIEILKKVGALLPDDHFVGTSGVHFDTYINKDALFPHTHETALIGKLFAEKLQHLDLHVVAAPAMGGIILSQWTAYYLSEIKGTEILSVYTEKDKGSDASNKDSKQIYKRGYDKILKDKKVVVIEDLTSTGGSLKKVVDETIAQGADVIAASVMVNKDPENITSEMFGVPFVPLAEYPVQTYSAEQCTLCENNIPINTTIGHGKAFLKSKNNA